MLEKPRRQNNRLRAMINATKFEKFNFIAKNNVNPKLKQILKKLKTNVNPKANQVY